MSEKREVHEKSMMPTTQLTLLRKLLEQCDRLHELERSHLIHQIKALERAKPVSHATQLTGRENERSMLSVMQQAREALPPREIASRLDVHPKTVSRWLAAAKRRGFVERVDGARYRVAKEVPPNL
jgi:predicted Rossmann fold nucleotide-binding protein DprA/Smf involved in DNA uptake